MATAVVHYAAAALTDRGRKRPTNEDAFGYSVEHGIYVVCDGMGGAAAGEIASSVAVSEVLRFLTHRDGANPLATDAERAVEAANQAIFSRAQRSQKLNGMGTTLVALLADDRQAWILNVGDSRGYRLRSAFGSRNPAGPNDAGSPRLEQITIDHSLVEEQIRLGQMSRAEALRSPLKNVITRALGTQSTVTADVFELDVVPGDLFLLCSDGLTRELSDSVLESLLSLDLPLDDLCARLIAAANQAGGHDNITCLLVRALAS
ncbi:MAG: protein phosphatase 2C domain-containing protein [Terracidiphilus sp.]